MGRTTLEWRNFDNLPVAELYELLRFRQSIFVVEQHSPYADLDGLDGRAVHLLMRQAGELTGRRVRVVPTRNAAEGFAALLALDPEGDATANAEVMTLAGRAVRIAMTIGSRLVLTATSHPGRAAPILTAGRVGLRGDNCEFYFRDFTVSAASP